MKEVKEQTKARIEKCVTSNIVLIIQIKGWTKILYHNNKMEICYLKKKMDVEIGKKSSLCVNASAKGISLQKKKMSL